MSKVFLPGIKDLKISEPSKAKTYTDLKCNVIVVAKYDFEAESEQELSVKKGVVLKLLNRMKNGWVLVQLLDEVREPGLVPSSYVDIAVNDPRHPITLQWLRASETSDGSKKGNTTFMDVEVKTLLENNAPLTFNNKPYPLSASASHYLTFENRYWYRVDVSYSTGEHGYLCRYYQDFYDLHVRLLENFNSLEFGETEDSAKLPKLPEPVPSAKCDSEDKDLFLNRCKMLSSYLTDLISKKHYQACPALVEWLEPEYKGLPGFVVPSMLNSSTESINQQILPGSVMLASKVKTTSSAPKTEAVPQVAPATQSKYGIPSAPTGPQRSHSKNIYNHYRQILTHPAQLSELQRSSTTKELGRKGLLNQYKTSATGLERSRTIQVPKSAPTGLERAKTINIPKAPPKIFSTPRIGGESPTLVASSPFTPQLTDSWIKCSIKTQGGDVLVVRVDKDSFATIEEFKDIIHAKVAFNSLFIKLPTSEAFEEIESPETDFVPIIKSAGKVFLLLT